MTDRTDRTDGTDGKLGLLVSLSPCLLVSLSPCLLVSLSPCLLVSLSPCLLVPLSLSLERLTARESRVQVVPPFDAFLAAPPAQVDDLPIPFAWEVEQALIEVFDFDAEAENFLRQGYEGRERVRILKAPRDAAAARTLARAFGFGGHPAERRAGTVDARQQSPDLGQQCVRFFGGKEFHRIPIRKVVWKTVWFDVTAN